MGLILGCSALAQAAADDAVSAVPRTRPARVDPPGLVTSTPLHPKAEQALRRGFAGGSVDALTYHYDGLRTGWNPNETVLTPATVASPAFGKLGTLAVEGNVLAQPLLVSAFLMPDGSTRDLLLVATGKNAVHAYDAQTLQELWKVNLGRAVKSSHTGCLDVVPDMGVSSTPVIVRHGPGSATVFLVAGHEPQDFVFQIKLHALDLATGADARPAVEIAPKTKMSDGSTMTLDPKNQWSRAGLAYANESIYVSIASHCDNNAGNISGWVLRYSQSLKKKDLFNTIETPVAYELANIWMSGFAPAVDAAGNLFVVTGNGAVGRPEKNWGESVLRLPPTLGKVADYFTPAAYDRLNNADLDFGSGGVMLIPQEPGQLAPPLAVAMGKDAVLYLLDQTRLGRVKANDAGTLQAQRLASSGLGLWGGPAYYRGPNGPVVYVQNDGGVLRSFSVATGAKPALNAGPVGTTSAGYGGSTPVVSSNGSAPGTGVVWLIRRGSTLQLEAYDAVNLGAPLYTGASGVWSNPRNNAFITPLQANGRVFVPAYGSVTVFGLAP